MNAIKTLAASLAILASTSSQIIATPLPPPFPYIRSPFGPRGDASPFHNGVDYTAAKGESIRTPEAGNITRISTNNDPCGYRVYLKLKDTPYELGYCHLFEKSNSSQITVGAFTLVKRYPIRLKPEEAIKLRAEAGTRLCNIILKPVQPPIKPGVTGVAYAEQGCNLTEGEVIGPFSDPPKFNNARFKVTHKVSADESFAPVGDSSTQQAHLHLNYGPGLYNALTVIAHETRKYCTKIFDGSTIDTCDTAQQNTVVFSQAALASKRFIDVIVHSTTGLDLDQAKFEISSIPPQAFEVRFGGSVTSSPLANGIFSRAAVREATDQIQNCLAIPDTGKTIICPKIYDGQLKNGKKIYTFRLGVNVNALNPGNYQIKATLQSVSAPEPTEFNLPFSIQPPNATLLVSMAQPGWGGLPATIVLTDLTPRSRLQFQISGNSPTCGSGERGAPIFSAAVPDTASFYAATNTTGVPYQLNGPSINRRNCSSFVAILPVPNPMDASQYRLRYWINATGRGQQFGGATFDWEYQVRFDSGDPWTGAGRSCIGGTVPNSGFFGTGAWQSDCSATVNF